MSDYDDYENNLFFPPTGDMSKLNDCNDGKRSVDVLVSAVEKCKELEEKLKIAINAIEQVLKEPDLMDAGMNMYLTTQLAKIKEQD